MTQGLDWTHLTNKFTVERLKNRENTTGENNQWPDENSTADGILHICGSLDQYEISGIRDCIDCLDKISTFRLAGTKCTNFEDYIL